MYKGNSRRSLFHASLRDVSAPPSNARREGTSAPKPGSSGSDQLLGHKRPRSPKGSQIIENSPNGTPQKPPLALFPAAQPLLSFSSGDFPPGTQSPSNLARLQTVCDKATSQLGTDGIHELLKEVIDRHPGLISDMEETLARLEPQRSSPQPSS